MPDWLDPATEPERPKPHATPQTRALEDAFRGVLGTKVSLSKGERGGRLVIFFYSEEELQSNVTKQTNNFHLAVKEIQPFKILIEWA